MAMKNLLEFDDAGADNDHPVKGVTVGHIRAWFDTYESMRTALQIIISNGPDKEPDRGDYDWSNTGDATDYGIAIAAYTAACVARAGLDPVCDHTWKSLDDVSENTVRCIKCREYGERQRDGSIYWPAT